MAVRELTLDEVGIRIDYFHGATDEHLERIGVDRARLPAPAAWRAFYEDDYARPIEQRANYTLAWVLDGEVVGFSSTDRIVYGLEAFMHLHIVDAKLRRRGLGVEFVKRSVEMFFDVLELEHLFSEPNALNVAPNRTLQAAGFRYVYSHETTPGPFNFPQVVTRWAIDEWDAHD